MSKPAQSAPLNARFERLPGSSRQYRDLQTGEILSRRQYDKINNAVGLQRITTRKAHETNKRRATQVKVYQKHLAAEGIKKNRREISADPSFKAHLKELAKASEAFDKKKTKKNEKALKEALKKLGLRDGVKDSVPIGKSPKAKTAHSRAAQREYRKEMRD